MDSTHPFGQHSFVNSEYPRFSANRPETSGNLPGFRDEFLGTLATHVYQSVNTR